MSRVQIELPDEWIFETEVDVRIGDINYGQHVGHDSVLSILHEARLRFLRQSGHSEIDVGGCGLIMADTVIAFKGEIKYPARLRVQINIGNWSRAGFNLVYCVDEISDTKRVAEAKTGMLCFDYNRRRPARVPEAFRAAFPA